MGTTPEMVGTHRLELRPVSGLPPGGELQKDHGTVFGQPLSEIAKAIDISRSTIERTVKRVIARWKKASRENPTDPVSAMANDRG